MIKGSPAGEVGLPSEVGPGHKARLIMDSGTYKTFFFGCGKDLTLGKKETKLISILISFT